MGQSDADSFLRLYMVPGMQHCDDGPGAGSFGQVGQLNVRRSAAQRGRGSGAVGGKGHGAVDNHCVEVCGEDQQHAKMTRPLCAYPQAAKYKGSGDTE